MDLTALWLQLSLAAVSLLANTLSAFAGGGAGLLQLPALILLGLPFAKALATHKLASVALGIGASGRHWREGSLNLHLSLLVIGCGLPGVWIGAKAVLNIPGATATLALGLLTIGLGLYSTRRTELGTQDVVPRLSTGRSIVGGLVLFGIGILNGSLTSGTGLFVTLWLVRWFGLSYTKAIAHTLILVGLGWNGTGAMVLGFSGEIHWEWLPMLIVGSLLGGYLGAHLSIARGNRLAKRAFEGLTLVMGSSLLLRGL